MTSIPLRICSIGSDASVQDWLQAKRQAHVGDAAFVAPLDFFEKQRIDPRKSPFFQRGEAALFVAKRGEKPVGRISAQILRDSLSHAQDLVGSFGFFDVAEDREAALALLDKARDWLRDRGVRRLKGPFNLTINEECGCQIDAFHLQPTYLMPQSRPWTAAFLEQGGLSKSIDMHAWRVSPGEVSDRAARIGALGAELGMVKARPIRKDRFDDEIRLLADIFNDAWAENWGFVPFRSADIDALSAALKPIYRSSYGYFMELDGEPVGVLIGVPNVNEAIADFDGRLSVINTVKLAVRMFGERTRTSRIPLAGIRRRYQAGLTGGILTAALAQALFKELQRRPMDWFEFSWVLETNEPARRYLKAIGAKPVITYRLFEGDV